MLKEVSKSIIEMIYLGFLTSMGYTSERLLGIPSVRHESEYNLDQARELRT